MHRSRVVHVCRPLVALTVALAASTPLISAESGSAVNSPAWVEGLAALGTGEFDRASRLIRQVAEAERDNERVRRVEGWVSAFEKLQAERRQRIQEDYEKYISWVKEDAKAGNFKTAIYYAALAYNEASDQEAFRKEAWLGEVVKGALKAAEAYENKKEWVKAATIYARLTDIFPFTKEYRDALDRTQAHIRLDYTYTPESDWKTAVQDITPGMARDAFRKINSEYLTEPVFKDAAVKALQQILRLVQEPKLDKVFPNLADEARVREFVSRVEARLEQAQQSESYTVSDLIKCFDRVLDINAETELLPQNVLVYEFTQGALQPLDRFSDMIWPADLQEFNKHTQGRFSGVGIQIRKDPGEPIKVISPLEDTPAYRAGVQPGDLITKINGKSANKYTINQAVREITGPAGTKVRLTFKRPGQEEEFDLELERQEITIFTIKGYERDERGEWKFMIDPQQKIAYLRMTNFTEGTIDELRSIVTRLRRREGMRGLIFDLRGNPGGPLKSAVEVADLFLPEDKRIVSTKDRHSKEWAMSSTSDLHFTDFPMIILANRTSASASEIVAGALQVHHRALVVGERTFGKGSVQQVLRLNNNNSAFLKLTTAHYYLPDGRCLHREEDSTTWGVDPDVEVKLVPKEIIQANRLRLETDILKGLNQEKLTKEDIQSLTELRQSTQPATSKEENAEDGEESDEVADAMEDEKLRDDPNNFPKIDPQLETAVMLMRVRLESGEPWPMRNSRIAANASATGAK